MLSLNFSPDFPATCLPELQAYLAELPAAWSSIRSERKLILDEVAAYAAARMQAGQEVRLVFICTHNSRRSHFGQIWAATAAAAFGLNGLSTYSGGTAATAFNSRAAAALQRAGFRIHRPEGRNPAYEVAWSGRRPAMIAYSKVYDDPANPRSGFAAIMTCTEADTACPMVPGANARFALPYEDPKSSDGTHRETSRYDERCRQIAAEMFYLCAEISARTESVKASLESSGT